MNHFLALALLLAVSPAMALAANAEPAALEPTYLYLTQDDGKQVKAPLLDDASAALPVARVDDDVISARELTATLATAHESFAGNKAGKKDFHAILDRMIAVRLVLLEARDIGIDEQPEVHDSIAAFKESALRNALKRSVLKGVVADPAEVERIYQDATREWKVTSLLFAKEKEAKALVASVKAGKSFDALAKQAVAAKQAEGGEPAAFLPRAQMLPPVLSALQKLRPGEVGAPFKVQHGYAVLKVEDVRNVDDPKLRAEATTRSLARKQKEALKVYYDGLLRKYVKSDEKLLKRIDFEAKKPGIAALAKDKRVLARIEGGSPITVADLAKAMQEQYWHGIDEAVRTKRVNLQKPKLFDALLSNAIVGIEARRQGIDKSAEYQREVSEYANQAIFAAFVSKVILPDVKVTEQEQEQFYAKSKSDFTLPAFYKLESIGFRDVKSAQAALDKLRTGTDFKWLKSNAEGQLPDGEGAVQFEGTTVAASAMPPDLAKLLAGSKAGDYRLYAAEKGQGHVIRLIEATPPELRAYADVKEEIRQKLFGDRVNGAVAEWAGKLRKAHTVKIYLTKIGS